MKLRNDAVNKGTSSLISTLTHVEKGAKIAKGEDALGGVMAQFSSLMSVMQDDFALMNDMEREYAGEKSEVEPTLPDELAVIMPSDPDSKNETVAKDSAQLPALVDAAPTFGTEQDFDDLLNKSMPLDTVPVLDLPDVLQSAMSIDRIDLMDLETVTSSVIGADVSVAPVMSVHTDAVPVSTPSINIPVTEIQVPTVQEVPEVLAEQIVQKMSQMLVEEIAVEEDAPRFEMSERLDLPDYMREQVRLLDDQPIESEDTHNVVEHDIEVGLRTAFSNAVDVQAIETVQSTQSQVDAVQMALQSLTTGSGLATQVSQQVQSVQPTVSTNVDAVSIQQQKNTESLKETKLPRMHFARQSFEELLEESQQKGTEQMGFRSKLIQRLEMVIQDPMGRMDVEVSKEVTGVNVKAVVPMEILSSLQGLDVELQSALAQRGLDLNQFELFERGEDTNSQGETNTSGEDVSSIEAETEQKILAGGILVNQRV